MLRAVAATARQHFGSGLQERSSSLPTSLRVIHRAFLFHSRVFDDGWKLHGSNAGDSVLRYRDACFSLSIRLRTCTDHSDQKQPFEYKAIIRPTARASATLHVVTHAFVAAQMGASWCRPLLQSLLPLLFLRGLDARVSAAQQRFVLPLCSQVCRAVWHQQVFRVVFSVPCCS